MEFQANEYQLFQHRAQRIGKEGNLLVTNFRLIFRGEDNAVQLSLGWEKIANVQYSPSSDPQGRAAMRISTSDKTDKPLAIQLSGNDKEDRFMALESLKVIIAIVWKRNSPIITSTVDDSIDYSIVGPTNRLIYDLVSVEESKSRASIDLTPELKRIIFNRFPAVKAAFLAEVHESKRMLEHKFWEVFFQSEYFNHNKKDDLSHSGRKLFAKYEPQNKMDQNETTSLMVDEFLLKYQQKTKVPSDVVAEIDLTATLGDVVNKRWMNESSAKEVTDDKINHLMNADSQMVLPVVSLKHDKERPRGLEDELSFSYGLPPAAHSIHLHPSNFTEDSSIIATTAGTTLSTQNDQEEEPSAFGKRRQSSAFGKSLVSSTSSTAMIDHAASSERLAQGFPEWKVAKNHWDQDVSRIRTYAQDKQITYFNLDQNCSSALLDDIAQQELQEIFTTITELLRLFYESIGSSSAGEYGLKRASNIIDRLKDIEEGLMQQVASRKTGSRGNAVLGRSSHASPAEEYKENLIQGFVVMIKRAKENHDRIVGVNFCLPIIADISSNEVANESRANKISLTFSMSKKQ